MILAHMNFATVAIIARNSKCECIRKVYKTLEFCGVDEYFFKLAAYERFSSCYIT